MPALAKRDFHIRLAVPKGVNCKMAHKV